MTFQLIQFKFEIYSCSIWITHLCVDGKDNMFMFNGNLNEIGIPNFYCLNQIF